MSADFVLASASPRRHQILSELGYTFEVMAADIDESPRDGESGAQLVVRLAREKAIAVRERIEGRLPVLAADTIVLLDDDVLGKPVDRDDALRMLLAMSERAHEVHTSVALASRDAVQVRVSRSRVVFRTVSPREAEQYWATGEPKDKAGAYGIQGIGGIFVRELTGSHSGVMGLPVCETEALLQGAGIRCLK